MLRDEALQWAGRRVEPGCDLNLLPRLGYPALDIAWLREAVWQHLAAAAEPNAATGGPPGASPMGQSMPDGAAAVLQDMQRTLRLNAPAPEWETLSRLPTYLYHLWPALRPLLRDSSDPSLPARLLLLAATAARLGLGPAAGADTEHNTRQSVQGRDPAPCHT